MVRAVPGAHGSARHIGTVLVLVTLSRSGSPEVIPWDDLLREVDRAGERLASGKERQHIRDRLNEAIEKNPKSGWRGLAKQLSQDLTDSVYRSWELPGTEDDVVKRPELYLFRTRISPHSFPRWDGGGQVKGFVKCSGNWSVTTVPITPNTPRTPWRNWTASACWTRTAPVPRHRSIGSAGSAPITSQATWHATGSDANGNC